MASFNSMRNPSGGTDGYMDWNKTGMLGPVNEALAKWGGDTGAMILDPLDLFGGRAKAAQAEQDAIARGSADRSINALREQYYKTQELQQPFVDLGTDALGGFGTYQRGETFDDQLYRGGNALARSGAASGMLNSSYTGENLSAFVNDLTNEDMNRQYQQQLNAVKIGQGASGQIGAAGQNFSQGAGGIYNNYGNAASQNALNYGQQRSDAFNMAGNAAAGAFNYYGS